MSKIFAVIGSPVEHSLSPKIHSHFGSQFKLDVNYKKILSTNDSFEQDVKRFFQDGGIGLNITVPFKELAFQLADHCTNRAKRSQSVNTLWLDSEQRLVGDTTDGFGLEKDWQRLGIDPSSGTIVILGAGGAARSVIATLLELSNDILVGNRTQGKAEELVAELNSPSNLGLLANTHHKPKIIINATSEGAENLVSDYEIEIQDCSVYDLSYGKRAEKFLSFCEKNKAAKCFDGLGMLIEQAAESFRLWNNLSPNTSGLHNTLKTLE